MLEVREKEISIKSKMRKAMVEYHLDALELSLLETDCLLAETPTVVELVQKLYRSIHSCLDHLEVHIRTSAITVAPLTPCYVRAMLLSREAELRGVDRLERTEKLNAAISIINSALLNLKDQSDTRLETSLRILREKNLMSKRQLSKGAPSRQPENDLSEDLEYLKKNTLFRRRLRGFVEIERNQGISIPK